MNILIIPSWYPDKPGDIGGSFFREQAIALQKSGNNVYVIDATADLPNTSFVKSFFNAKRIHDQGLIVYKQRIQTRGMARIPEPNLVYYRKRVEHLYELMLKHEGNINIDVIHAHSWFPAGVVACEIGKKYGIPVVITEHFSGILKGELDSKRVKYLKYCTNNADAFICVGNALADKVSEYTGCDRTKLQVIPNMYSHIFENISIPKKVGNNFTFFSVGSLIPRKRHSQLLRCFANAFSVDDDVRLLIGGDGELRDELQKQIDDLDIGDRAKLLGQLSREQVVENMTRANAFVLTSSFETFGVVYIEALACGLPLIGSRNGGAQDIINGHNGILVDVDNDEQLTEALIKMRENIGSYNYKALQEYAKDNFSEEAVVRELTEVYKKLVRA
ncbi:MAG: glycosyltransferase [Ruminococcus sp.]|nr:glycosyltransferase [Ruminococcus sp.]